VRACGHAGVFMLPRVPTPSSLVREIERERDKESKRKREREREKEKRDRKREKFKRNDGCLGTFSLSSYKYEIKM